MTETERLEIIQAAKLLHETASQFMRQSAKERVARTMAMQADLPAK